MKTAVPNSTLPVEANPGEKMIEIRLRFWTNGIAPKRGQVIPKHAWTAGAVNIQANKAHGIVPKKGKPSIHCWMLALRLKRSY